MQYPKYYNDQNPPFPMTVGRMEIYDHRNYIQNNLFSTVQFFPFFFLFDLIGTNACKEPAPIGNLVSKLYRKRQNSAGARW